MQICTAVELPAVCYIAAHAHLLGCGNMLAMTKQACTVYCVTDFCKWLHADKMLTFNSPSVAVKWCASLAKPCVMLSQVSLNFYQLSILDPVHVQYNFAASIYVDMQTIDKLTNATVYYSAARRSIKKGQFSDHVDEL